MRFPRYHLATSVVNRILNIADRVQAIPMPSAPPAMPEVQQQGEQLDKALSTPPAAVPAPEGLAGPAAVEAAQGGSAADVIGQAAIMDGLQ